MTERELDVFRLRGRRPLQRIGLRMNDLAFDFAPTPWSTVLPCMAGRVGASDWSQSVVVVAS